MSCTLLETDARREASGKQNERKREKKMAAKGEAATPLIGWILEEKFKESKRLSELSK